MKVADGLHLSATKYHNFPNKIKLSSISSMTKSSTPPAATRQSKSNRKSYEWLAKNENCNATKVLLISATIYNEKEK